MICEQFFSSRRLKPYHAEVEPPLEGLIFLEIWQVQAIEELEKDLKAAGHHWQVFLKTSIRPSFTRYWWLKCGGGSVLMVKAYSLGSEKSYPKRPDIST